MPFDDRRQPGRPVLPVRLNGTFETMCAPGFQRVDDRAMLAVRRAEVEAGERSVEPLIPVEMRPDRLQQRGRLGTDDVASQLPMKCVMRLEEPVVVDRALRGFDRERLLDSLQFARQADAFPLAPCRQTPGGKGS